MRKLARASGIVAVLATGVTVPAQQVDVTKLGPQVGERVPALGLTDHRGRAQTIRSVAGPKGTMLVFFRSADWWPYCRTQLVELQGNLATITAEGYGVAALSYDSPETLRSFADRHGIAFPLLSDPGSRTIRAWGLLNEAGTGREAGIPHPGTFLIDPSGRVVERAFEANYRERSSGTSILARLGAKVEAVAATTVAGKQISARAGSSDAEASPGKRLTLIVDVTPGPKMHVYSPGQTGYIPIALKLDDSSDYRLAHPAVFPPPGTYYFEPLKETVKVFDAPFRIRQEITLALTRELRQRASARETLTIRGTLDYQACDDAVCYRPDSIPLVWTVRLVPFQQ